MNRSSQNPFNLFPQALKDEIQSNSSEILIPQGTEILREGQFIKVIPLVQEGLIKVVSRYEDKDFLLYYIKPNESCVMSLSSGLKGEKSRVYAIAESDTRVLTMPMRKVEQWVREYPEINFLFYDEYNARYSELIDAIHQILFYKMDCRVMNYLKERSEVTGKNPLRISHREIASDLGTAREVVSRIIKKLENEGLLSQNSNSIEIL